MSAAVLEADPSQDRAVELIASARIGIVTGGPGTGKTTCLERALGELPPSTKIELAAPTGKAAKRMHETTGRSARTIHRLLGWRGDGRFMFDHHNPLQCDLVVVDESSMLDIELGAALFDAIGPHTRLIMLGDVDQLPSVGPGQVFADLIELGAIPVARLTHVHRSAHDAWVNRNAPRVLAGGPIELDTVRGDRGFEWRNVGAAANVIPELQKIALDDPGAKILIPQRTGAAGLNVANPALQTVYNIEPWQPGDPCLQREHGSIRTGDTVLQTKNDYTLAVFNGEIGTVIDMGGGRVVVDFEDRTVTYASMEQAGALELAYALTVHKAQGSEFPRVVFVCHSTHTHMLNRRLFYTAITRTRGAVLLVGDELGLERALSNGFTAKRNTTLIERIKGELEEITHDVL